MNSKIQIREELRARLRAWSSEHSREHAREHSREHAREHSREHSSDHSGGRSGEQPGEAASDTLSIRLGERLAHVLRFEKGMWAAFQPVGFEPDIRPAFALLPSIEFVFPRVEGNELKFYRSKNHSAGELSPGENTSDQVSVVQSSLVKNQWGILEPDPARSQPVALHELQGFLIPALAFDSQCNRMGRGRGFYDRTLNDLKKQAPHFDIRREGEQMVPQSKLENHVPLIGIALDHQIYEAQLPTEPHDFPMDWVLTESRVFESRLNSLARLKDRFASLQAERKSS